MRLIDDSKYGPAYRFDDHHVYRTLLTLSDCRHRGRKVIAESIGIGEGSIRTILDYLRERDLVNVEQTGVTITPEGQEFLEQLPIRLKRLEPTELSLGMKGVAVQVKKHSDNISSGIEQRDSAIRAGAEGATTAVVRDGRLLVPPDFVLDEDQPRIAKKLRESFDLSEDDVIIVGTASDYVKAEDGALAAAFDII